MQNTDDHNQPPRTTSIHCRALIDEKARLLRAAQSMLPQMTLTAFIMHAAHAKADLVLKLEDRNRNTYKMARASILA